MTAAEARAASAARKDAAEAAFQTMVANFHKAATPIAISNAMGRGLMAAPLERAVLERKLAPVIARGEQQIFNYEIHKGAVLSEHDLVGSAFLHALGDALKDMLEADGFKVVLQYTQYMSSGQRQGPAWMAPPSMANYLEVQEDIYAWPRSPDWLIGANMDVSW